LLIKAWLVYNFYVCACVFLNNSQIPTKLV
jgi:hypothetical protein